MALAVLLVAGPAARVLAEGFADVGAHTTTIASIDELPAVARHEPPALVVVALADPAESAAAIRAVRATPGMRLVPVVMIACDRADVALAYRAGANGCTCIHPEAPGAREVAAGIAAFWLGLNISVARAS